MILLDTIAYNTYLELMEGKESRKNHKLKAEEFKNFVSNYNGEKYIHSATLFELLIKCIKSNGGSNLNMFVDDFNSLKKNNIKVINETTWYFDWKGLVEKSEKGEEINISDYIDEKIKYEVISISRFFDYILLIISERLFDKYGEEVGIYLFRELLHIIKTLVNMKIEMYLLYYYNTDQKKEITNKKLDNLFGYVLEKLEYIIKNKLTITETFVFHVEFLEKHFGDVNRLEERVGKGGAEKAREILNDLKPNEIKQLMVSKINELEEQIIDGNKRYLTSSEKLYYQFGVLKTLQQGYKITKNDFTDCTIFSAFDCYEEYSNGVVITFDKTLRKLMKENSVYYSEEIYNRIFEL
ncbi:hypothetical protein [Bacillus wiedmannii]|uniref:hypothetical protein n=1 Tax=Bacillus wiedmannii TaxID=1890302 RepID=UPI0025A18D7B|nr:hypothetical protein [Bacillus wiedmannii]MDM5267590.1 hypothetical protein [Bacillus wiedmannii]